MWWLARAERVKTPELKVCIINQTLQRVGVWERVKHSNWLYEFMGLIGNYDDMMRNLLDYLNNKEWSKTTH